MNFDYLSEIRNKSINGRTFYNTYDIRKYLIDDYDDAVDKISYYNLNIANYNNEYIDLYSLILLIAFSSDYRTHKYKFYLTRCTIEKLRELINPELCIDRANTLKYKKKENEAYKYNSKISISDKKDIYKIILDEINFSLNTNLFRQII